MHKRMNSCIPFIRSAIYIYIILKQTFYDVSNNGEIVIDLDDIRRDLNNLNERHLDVQTRSMRENLVFTGIPHKNDKTIEETENIIRNFMYTELKMETTVDFHRAHRFGKETEFRDRKDGSRTKTRPIVCRFKSYKDREIVRSSAKELKGTHYGIQEQFPKEINDKRKMLWPYFKQAKEDEKAYLKRDKLFIDGNEFTLPDDDEKYEKQGALPRATPHTEPQRQTIDPTLDPAEGVDTRWIKED
ncbi:unnamed protein product [Mytilus coruscus]|uniref:Uncharacterized protein n=1 Tax=Mytilus coruscus TaxID=42192 RepID=A0A6J8CF82_MYTCO|nr:unnamed protein product [Mytilus coruscus]